MIQLSNSDAEQVCLHLGKHLCKLKQALGTRNQVSTKQINEARMLGILINKISNKLDKACPGRQTK